MPYIELQWLPPQSQASSYQYSQQGQQQQRGGGILEEHRQYNGNNRDAAPVAFRLLWKVSGGGGGTGGGDQQDEIAFDANITSHDVIALHFSSRDDGSDARSSAAQQGSHRASQSTPLFALLSMNYRPVCRVPISPEAAREFASSRPLFLNVIAHLRTAATAGATTTTTTSTVIDILRGVTALSHYTMVADVLCVPGEELQRNDHHNAGEGGGLGGGVVQRRALYVWNNGESMLEASRHDLAIVS
ncbi:Hypothetical protein, putative [Bodo saltans]|uniref:Uncharacterized protein n=1 Tax=Bodo saltans TaxID=75058 RepID=A0A0S4JCM3_BODSA|nr:Hypothetical protein, putative [Bodo saltans]|eukprot:CUG89214.1 Hypothetical protein, putative [Bodo saltans]